MTTSNKLLRNVHESCPSLLLIEDTVRCSGRPLLYSFVKRALTRDCEVKYVQYDCPRFSDTQALKDLGVSPIPLYQDNQTSNAGCGLQSYDTLNHIISSSTSKTLIVLDSISTVSLFENVSEISTTLRKIEQQVKGDREISVVALMHSDVHSEDELKKLRYVFPCVLRISKSQVAGKFLCSGMSRKTGGKVIEKEELFELDSNYTLIRVEDYAPKVKDAARVEKDTTEHRAVPSATFRLGLSASEEKARSEVVLPFASKRTAAGTGQVIYEAEDVDWDEEDPDDDLDI